MFSASCAFADVDATATSISSSPTTSTRESTTTSSAATGKEDPHLLPSAQFAPHADALYRNNGNGTFTDVSREAGIAGHRATGSAPSSATTTMTGRLDLFVANDTTPNFLYHNDGRGVFREVALSSGVAVASDGRPRAGMGTDFGDYDGDGASICS